MREAVLKLTMDYKMTKHVLNNGTLAESRTWLLVITWHCYFISFNSEHPVALLDETYSFFTLLLSGEIGHLWFSHMYSAFDKPRRVAKR